MDVTPIQPGSPMPVARNPMDAARSAFYERTPDAQYPDGYLGTMESRRQRLYKEGLPRRSHGVADRGVHVGEAVGGNTYFWPDEFGPMSAIESQMRGERFVPMGVVIAAGEPVNVPSIGNDEMLRAAAPSWTSGGPGIGTPTVAYQSGGMVAQ